MRLLEVIKDHDRVGQQRLRAWRSAARRVAAVVKRRDLAPGIELVQVEGHSLGIPGIPAKAQQLRHGFSPLSCGWYPHSPENFTVSEATAPFSGRLDAQSV